MKERTIVPGPYAFANGSQYETWVARNCARCSKYDPETMSESRCAIDHALVIALFGDGIVPLIIADRMGLTANKANYTWQCGEFDPI